MSTAASTMSARSTEMTDRQLAAQVRYGRKVTFETPELKAKSVTGYVMGFDADNVRIVVIDGERILNRSINRDYIAATDYHSESTMSSEPVARDLERMIKKFRDKILEQYFPDRTRR